MTHTYKQARKTLARQARHARGALDDARDMAEHHYDRARRTAEDWYDSGEHAARAAHDWAEEKPHLAVLAALAAGVIIGAFLTRRSS